jgi:O-antigen/teichoic acid export membrane protein
MNRAYQTLRSFANRGGHLVFSSMITSKILNFILSVIIVRVLAENIYGNISYALSIMQILIPVAGLGLHHALLRFGAIENSVEAKNNLFKHLLKWGSLFSLIIMVIVYIFADLICTRLPEAKQYLQLFLPLIFTFFLAELIFSFFRIHKNNKTYSIGIIIKSVVLFAASYGATMIWGGKGYALAYSLTPLLVMLIMLFPAEKNYKLIQTPRTTIKLKPYIKYGIWVGFGSIASQLVLLLDTIMVGNIMADSYQLAIYKVATIIPVNLLFIPMVLLKTDYVYIAEKHKDRKFLINYYKKYLLIFSAIFVVIIVGWLIFGDLLISIFGSEYSSAKPLVSILLIMVGGAFLTRIPLGNMINALGKSQWNSISNLILLFVNFILNAILIPEYGLTGAAIATSISVWLSGIINIFLFNYYLKNMCEK